MDFRRSESTKTTPFEESYKAIPSAQGSNDECSLKYSSMDGGSLWPAETVEERLVLEIYVLETAACYVAFDYSIGEASDALGDHRAGF